MKPYICSEPAGENKLSDLSITGVCEGEVAEGRQQGFYGLENRRTSKLPTGTH